MKLYEIDEKRFKFDALKKFLKRVTTKVAGGDKNLAYRKRQLKNVAGDELQKIYSDFGVDEREVFSIFKGESSFNTKAFNASGAVGLFQAMPAVAKELGTSSVKIHQMTAAEQVNLYHKYLSMHSRRLKTKNFKGRLGILQAAPGYANRKPNEAIYPKGSKAWKQNEPWRPADDGDITIASISDYYRRKA
jgi:hypothetical protein